MKSTLVRKSWIDPGRHDIRSLVPEAIRPVVQNGMLEALFRDALRPELLFAQASGREPIPGRTGDTITKTRTGLMTPTTAPLAGSDAAAGTYGLEQWSVTLDRYGKAVDTNMDGDIVAIASLYARDVQTLGIHAGQSLNRIARNRLYSAYAGGRTFTTGADTAETALIVSDVTGFDTVNVNGIPTTVSATHPLAITIDGAAASVVAVDAATKTLTLAVAKTWSAGDAVVAANAPYQVLPGTTGSLYDIATTDIATFAKFMAAVTRMRSQNVPTINGAYLAHIDPETEGQLFADADFKNALRGRVDSPQLQDLSIGRFAGIDWIRNNEAPVVAGGAAGATRVHQSIVMGADAIMASPASWLGTNRQPIESAGAPIAASMVEATGSNVAVELVVRPPQDRLQLTVSTAWSWVGDFGVPSDTVSGDSARFKRAVVVASGSS